jgi:hypothetical protein
MHNRTKIVAILRIFIYPHLPAILPDDFGEESPGETGTEANPRGPLTFTTVRSQGGDLKLVNLSKRIGDLLKVTKLYSFFDVKVDEAAAVASFSRAAW